MRIDSVFAIRKAEAQKGATQHCVFGDFSIFNGFWKVNHKSSLEEMLYEMCRELGSHGL